MADTAARLTDEVLPRVPVRRWVLSLPYEIRLAWDKELVGAVLAVFLRVVYGWYRRQARAQGYEDSRCGFSHLRAAIRFCFKSQSPQPCPHHRRRLRRRRGRSGIRAGATTERRRRATDRRDHSPTRGPPAVTARPAGRGQYRSAHGAGAAAGDDHGGFDPGQVATGERAGQPVRSVRRRRSGHFIRLPIVHRTTIHAKERPATPSKSLKTA